MAILVIYEDRLSKLHESILVQIVNILPIEESIRLCVLSKAWRNVACVISRLNFNQKEFDRVVGRKVTFGESVFKTLSCRHGAYEWRSLKNPTYIESFRLLLDVNEEIALDIRSWILFLIRHKVQRITLLVSTGNFDSFPKSMFTATTLTSLRFGNVMLAYVPKDVCLPKVRTLEFHFVRWKDDQDINRLIKGCLILETLILFRSNWKKKNVLVFVGVRLKLLHLQRGFKEQDIDVSASNLNELWKHHTK